MEEGTAHDPAVKNAGGVKGGRGVLRAGPGASTRGVTVKPGATMTLRRKGRSVWWGFHVWLL